MDLSKKMTKAQAAGLKTEKEALEASQKELRNQIVELQSALLTLKDDEIEILRSGETDRIAEVKNEIKCLEDKIRILSVRYKENGEIIELYSRILKNDSDRCNGSLSSWSNLFLAIGTLGLSAFGLTKSYVSDVEGTLSNKKTLDWVKSIPGLVRSLVRK